MSDIIWIALGLFVVFEGLMPTLAPKAYREMLAMVSQANEKTIRKIGIIMITLGTIIILIAKS